MTRHIESYRYEIQYSDDADFVAYQRKVERWRLADGFDVDDSGFGGLLSAGRPLRSPPVFRVSRLR